MAGVVCRGLDPSHLRHCHRGGQGTALPPSHLLGTTLDKYSGLEKDLEGVCLRPQRQESVLFGGEAPTPDPSRPVCLQGGGGCPRPGEQGDASRAMPATLSPPGGSRRSGESPTFRLSFAVALSSRVQMFALPPRREGVQLGAGSQAWGHGPVLGWLLAERDGEVHNRSHRSCGSRPVLRGACGTWPGRESPAWPCPEEASPSQGEQRAQGAAGSEP